VGWTFAGDGTLNTSAVIVNDQLFIGSSTGNVYELDANAGTQTSVVNVGGPDGGTMSVAPGSETVSIAVAGGHLIVPTSTGAVGL
jgi:hypothetical protein